MAEKRISLPEDYLRIGEPAANRQSVFSAIMDALKEEEQTGGVIPAGVPRETTVLEPEQREAALTTQLRIPPEDYGVNLAGVRFPAPPRPEARGVVRGKAGAAPVDGEGIYEWIDEKGVRHATNVAKEAPEEARFIPREEPTIDIPGVPKLFGPATPEALGVLGRAAETDAQREDRIVSEVMEAQGMSRAEATKHYRSKLREVTGEPAAAEAPKTYEDKVALRDKIVQNTQNLIQQKPSERREILKQSAQLMKLRGIDKLKKPEQTISTEIEGQRVDIPVSKWDPKKHGKGAAKGDVSTVVTNFESVTGANPAGRGTEEYKKDFFKWRKALGGKKRSTLEDEILDTYFSMVKKEPYLAEEPARWDKIEKGIRDTAKKIRKGAGGVVKPSPPTAGKEAWLKNVMGRHGFDRAKAERAYESKLRS